MRLWILLCCCPVALFAQERKVLIIGIDGCRPDALQIATTPNIDALTQNSTYSYDALTQAPTWSGPGWSSMLTAVWSNKHGVVDNSFVGSDYGAYPHLFDRIKTQYPEKYLASVCQWGPINDQIVNLADVQINAATQDAVTTEAVNQLAMEELDVLFLHYDDVDHAGHEFQFSQDVPEYIVAIESVDQEVGILMNALEFRPNFANEDWMIVLSTDHGGLGYSHGGGSIEERNIFTIFSGDLLENEQILAVVNEVESDMSNALNVNQNDVYGIVDDPIYEFGDGMDFTIELKFKTNGWVGDPAIVSDKNWVSGYNPGFVISCQTDLNTWKFNLGDGTDRIDLNGGIVGDGEWHHLAVSVDRDGETFIWQDGSMLGSVNTGLQQSVISGFPLVVAQDGTQNYDYDTDGWVDELRVWGEALSPETLSEWACENLSTEHEAYDQLLGYWKMEELGDFITYGTGPNSVDMLLVNGPFVSLENPMTCYIPEGEVPEIVDVAYTIMDYLCVDIDPDWNLDGQSWGNAGAGCSVGVPNEDLIEGKVWYNASQDEIIVEGLDCTKCNVTVYDMNGRLLLDQFGTPNQPISIRHFPTGIYVVEIIEGSTIQSLRFFVE